MGLSWTEIITKVWISFSTFIRSGGGLSREKYLAMASSFRGRLKTFKMTLIDANMSIKVHVLYIHLDKFPDNGGDMCNEQRERFH